MKTSWELLHWKGCCVVINFVPFSILHEKGFVRRFKKLKNLKLFEDTVYIYLFELKLNHYCNKAQRGMTVKGREIENLKTFGWLSYFNENY